MLHCYKYCKLTFLLLMCSYSVLSQSISPQVINTTGGSVQVEGYYIDFNVGETVIQTVMGSPAIVTQGFLQPADTSGVVATSTIQKSADVTIYPNPTTSFLHIKIDASTDYYCQIYNMAASKTLTKSVYNPQQINVKDLPSGQYWLCIRPENMTEKWFRFTKI